MSKTFDENTKLSEIPDECCCISIGGTFESISGNSPGRAAGTDRFAQADDEELIAARKETDRLEHETVLEENVRLKKEVAERQWFQDAAARGQINIITSHK